jgi:thioredoxin-like negative regulator of GroEL
MSSSVSASRLKGLIELDELSFPRVVDGTKDVFVVFQEFSWKPSDSVQAIVPDFADVIFAQVDGSESKDLVAKFKVTHFPSYIFFAKGQSVEASAANIISGEHLESHDLADFVHANQNPEIRELKQLASQFAAAAEDEKKTLLSEAEGLISKLSGDKAKKYASYFVTTMKKILEKGKDFVTSEIKRLDNLSSGKSATAEKKREFAQRINVLNAFKDIQA